VPDALGVQLLLARELCVNPENRRQAEALYLQLADRFTSPDIYRGLFKLYETTDRMIEVLNFIDRVFTTLRSEDDIPATDRERARDRGRTMLQVLKSEPALVGSLLLVVKRELYAKRERKLETWHFLAGLAARVRKLDRAEELYRDCLVKAPPHLEASIYSGLLDALWMQKKYDEVIAVCRNALYGEPRARNTTFILFHAQLAAALTEKEKWDEALAECDKAIKLAAETPKIRLQCQRARILGAAERFDAAVAECEAMLKPLTDPAEIKLVRYALSTIFSYKGDHDKSEAQLLKILEDDPNDSGANNDLGYHWADRNKNLDEAERMIRKAIEVDRLQRRDDADADPDNAAYLDSLGWVLFRKGKLEEAREWLEKAVAIYVGAEDPTVWDHLGDVYARLEQPKKAREAYKLAIKLYTDYRHGKKEGRQEEAKRKLKMLTE
jgi:tetratricopeptide (TPR) repeat protein